MTSYSKLLDEYLVNSDKKSILNDYKKNQKNTNVERFDDKNKIINDFFYTELRDIITNYFGLIDIRKLQILGSGTQGVVLAIKTNHLKQGFDELSKKTSRIKGPYYESELPEEIALKFQLLDTDSNYWEKRMIREEYILHYLNEESSSGVNAPKTIIRDAIPKLYFGCTLKYKDVFFRLTFMELISPEKYITVDNWITNFKHVEFSDKAYEKIENIVKSLWRLKVSHNDLSIRNIMLGIAGEYYGKVKLIDFGLSEILNEPISDKNEYVNLFKDKSKDEQNGSREALDRRCSNVEKLKELCTIFNYSNC